MLIIRHTTKQIPDTVWHIGYPLHSEKKNIFVIQDIQADGDELNEIYDTCPIPLNNNCRNLVQSFYGDIARTIVLNLKG